MDQAATTMRCDCPCSIGEGRAQIRFFEIGVVVENFGRRRAGRQKLQNVGDPDPGSPDMRTPGADRRIDGDPGRGFGRVGNRAQNLRRDGDSGALARRRMAVAAQEVSQLPIQQVGLARARLDGMEPLPENAFGLPAVTDLLFAEIGFSRIVRVADEFGRREMPLSAVRPRGVPGMHARHQLAQTGAAPGIVELGPVAQDVGDRLIPVGHQDAGRHSEILPIRFYPC